MHIIEHIVLSEAGSFISLLFEAWRLDLTVALHSWLQYAPHMVSKRTLRPFMLTLKKHMYSCYLMLIPKKTKETTMANEASTQGLRVMCYLCVIAVGDKFTGPPLFPFLAL